MKECQVVTRYTVWKDVIEVLSQQALEQRRTQLYAILGRVYDIQAHYVGPYYMQYT